MLVRTPKRITRLFLSAALIASVSTGCATTEGDADTQADTAPEDTFDVAVTDLTDPPPDTTEPGDKGAGDVPLSPMAAKRAKVLAYIAGLPQGDTNRVLSGQHVGFGDGVPNGFGKYMTALEEATGKTAALLSVDFGYGKLNTESVWDLSIPNQVLIDFWNEGGLVTISWHARNPWTGGSAWDKMGQVNGPVDLSDLLTEGTDAHTTWMGQLDTIAGALAELRDAGVVVIWRPFHECTAGSFWWGQRGAIDSGQFVSMWRQMHDLFTGEKGLDNLLWNYNAGDTDKTPADFAYPGDAYADLVSEDDYSVGHLLEGYDALTALGKPYALGEVGPNEPDGTYDYLELIDVIRSTYPKVTYWNSWGGPPQADWSMVGNLNADALLDDPWVITQD